MVGSRKQYVTNLDGTHILIAGHQHAHCAGNVRGCHGCATQGCVVGRSERFVIGRRHIVIVMHCRTVNAITRRYNSPPLGIACFIEAINPLVLIVAVGINTILLQTSNWQSNAVLLLD